jgi:hypothetical protein
MERRNADPTEYVTMPQWCELWRIWKDKGLSGMYKKAEGDVDDNLLRMRSIAIWEAQKWMERGVSDRDNSATFLA